MKSPETRNVVRGYSKAAATAVLFIAASLSHSSFAGKLEQHLGDCKAAVNDHYGQETRIRMIKARSYKGVQRVKFKVFLEAQDMTVIECVSDETAKWGVVLLTREGDVLTS